MKKPERKSMAKWGVGFVAFTLLAGAVPAMAIMGSSVEVNLPADWRDEMPRRSPNGPEEKPSSSRIRGPRAWVGTHFATAMGLQTSSYLPGESLTYSGTELPGFQLGGEFLRTDFFVRDAAPDLALSVEFRGAFSRRFASGGSDLFQTLFSLDVPLSLRFRPHLLDGWAPWSGWTSGRFQEVISLGGGLYRGWASRSALGPAQTLTGRFFEAGLELHWVNWAALSPYLAVRGGPYRLESGQTGNRWLMELGASI